MYMSNKSLFRETVKVASLTIFLLLLLLRKISQIYTLFFFSLAHYLILIHAFKYHVMIL